MKIIIYLFIHSLHCKMQLLCVEKYNHVCQYKFVKFIALLRLFSILYIDCILLLYIVCKPLSYSRIIYGDIEKISDRMKIEYKRQRASEGEGEGEHKARMKI